MTGPFDDTDEVNHDPDSMVGEEDEEGFDELGDLGDWQAVDDDGFDDAGDDEEEENDGEDEDEEE
jgi:hypothetical protein